MNDYLVVFCTFPTINEADSVTGEIIHKHLAACANRIDRVQSLFHWHGAVEHEEETLVIYKTHKSQWSALEQTIRTMHSYDEPEIIAMPIVAGSESYLQWIKQETGKAS